jgi:hypothetical protein
VGCVPLSSLIPRLGYAIAWGYYSLRQLRRLDIDYCKSSQSLSQLRRLDIDYCKSSQSLSHKVRDPSLIQWPI